MPRLRSERWPIAIGFGLVFGLIVLGTAGRLSENVPLAVMLPIGIGVALLVALLFLLAFIRDDTRALLLAARNPDAVVVNVRTDGAFLVDLTEGLGRILAVNRVGSLVTLVAGRDGLSFSSGFRSPTEIVSIPWTAVGEISLGQSFKPDGWGAVEYSRLRVQLLGDQPGSVSFGVERINRIPSSVMNRDEADLLDLATQINAQRGRAPAARTQGAHKGLDVTPTAWSLTRIGPVSLGALLVVAQGIAVIGFIIARATSNLDILWWALAVYGILLVIGLIRGRALLRASAAERRAAYTTMQRSHLDLEQRHPVTGVVIRAAGAPALTKQEFAALLAR